MHLPALWLVLLLVLPSNARKKIRRPSPEESGKFFEGDIMIPEEEEEELLEEGEASAGIIGSHYRWAHATIPYLFSNAFGTVDTLVIKEYHLNNY
ncbi:unnamed protein product [Allacma fusca]|uniref:Uncharacterized protein n=1 Tax=Allacma fusca TaxID=39272 RepID=A0A8J2KX36_9HEXA|nr:unnamed protein product [Allacma fusca]